MLFSVGQVIGFARAQPILTSPKTHAKKTQVPSPLPPQLPNYELR